MPSKPSGGTFTRGARATFFRLGLPFRTPAGELVGAGLWHLLIAVEPPKPLLSPEYQVGFDGQTRGKPLPYCALITTRSALNFSVNVQQPDTSPGSPVLIEATLTAFGGPWTAERIIADVDGPRGLAVTVPLVEQESGRFTARYEPIGPGTHRLRVRAHGRSPLGIRFQREVTATAAVMRASLWTGPWKNPTCGCLGSRPEQGEPMAAPSFRRELLCLARELWRRCRC